MSGRTFIFSALIAVLSFAGNVSAEPRTTVIDSLHERHHRLDYAALESQAGGEDELVKDLLSYRPSENAPPYVEMRVVKLLLNYAGRPEVEAYLSECIESPDKLGLARLIAIHLDQVADVKVRERLALKLVARAEKEPRLRPYAETMRQSSDESVRRLAREAFPE